MGGNPIGIYELPRRAETIRCTLEGDDRFTFVEPVEHGAEPIRAVHDAGLVEHLASAWQRVAAQADATSEVVPDTFLHPALREGMGPAPLPADAVAGLVQTATERFGRDGYEDTKWAHIAADVGVWPTALYHYFES